MKIQDNKGFTLIELLIVVAIIGIIAAVALPGLLRARIAGNEASAIGSMRAISSGEATFASSCGGGGYSATIVGLFTPPTGAPAGTGFISPDLPTDPTVKSGYTVAMAPGVPAPLPILAAACNAVASVSTFHANATPVGVGSTGQRSFAIDQRGTVYALASGAAIVAGMGAAVPLQ